MTAAMGILVHQSFQNEIANGVGVTKNIYLPGPGWEGHYVNVQTGENLVTNPEPGSIPEEYIIANRINKIFFLESLYDHCFICEKSFIHYIKNFIYLKKFIYHIS